MSEVVTYGVGRGAKALLVRIHDGRIKSNWGGRATSIALLDIFSESAALHSADVLSGNYILRGFGEPVDLSQRTGPRGWMSSEPPPVPLRADHIAFNEPLSASVKSLLASHRYRPIISWIRNRIKSTDHVIINGEGDFILKRRPTLWRCLIIAAIAKALGKRVSIINTILSAAEDGGVDPDVRDAVGEVFQFCDFVAFRDPESHRLAVEMYGGAGMAYIPDALYAWRRNPLVSRSDELSGSAAEGLSWEARRRLERPFVAISGSSVNMGPTELTAAKIKLRGLIRGILARDLEVLLLPTCDGDRWMLQTAREAGAVALLPSISLEVGWRLLAKAEVFVSGRYHPTILASIVGTPSILMRSNSHKTRSLQMMLGTGHVKEHRWFSDGASLSPIFEHIEHALDRRGDLSDHLLGVTSELSAEAWGVRSHIGL